MSETNRIAAQKRWANNRKIGATERGATVWTPQMDDYITKAYGDGLKPRQIRVAFNREFGRQVTVNSIGSRLDRIKTRRLRDSSGQTEAQTRASQAGGVARARQFEPEPPRAAGSVYKGKFA